MSPALFSSENGGDGASYFSGLPNQMCHWQGFAGGGPFENSACLVISTLFAFLTVATLMNVLK